MLAAVLLALMVPVPPADATVIWSPDLTITGDPTGDEIQTIQTAWTLLTEGFPSTASCMEPLVVQVVDRAEDYYSTPINFSIAAFYRYPPDPMVVIEHGKVTMAVIVHEFAHHMDRSCGFGTSAPGEAFLVAEGYGTDQNWIRGTRWDRVPAERFAEGVLSTLGVAGVEIFVGDEALGIIADWALSSRDVPVEVAPDLVVL